MNREENVAVIPARAGSKRLPGKNTAMLGGKPMISWTLEAALESGCFGEIVVSTDSPETAAVAAAFPPPVRVCRRPEALAGDTTPSQDVLSALIRQEGWEESRKRICMLQPTSPLRRAGHILASLDLLEESWDSVIGICEYEFPPELSMSYQPENGALAPLWPDSPLTGGARIRTQDFPARFRPNGAIYWAWIRRFAANAAFYTPRMRGYVMPWEHSVDIDTLRDLEWGRLLLEHASNTDSSRAAADGA